MVLVQASTLVSALCRFGRSRPIRGLAASAALLAAVGACSGGGDHAQVDAGDASAAGGTGGSSGATYCIPGTAPNRAVLCAAPDYLDRRGTPRRVQDLVKHECVIFPALAPKGVWSLQRGTRKYAVGISGSLETNDMESVHAAVLAGLGVGILPLYMAADPLKRGAMRTVLEPVRAMGDSSVYLVYPPNRTITARVRAVIDFFVARSSPVPPWEVAA